MKKTSKKTVKKAPAKKAAKKGVKKAATTQATGRPPSANKKAVHQFVRKHPGTTAEIVRDNLGGLTAKQVSYLLRELRESGHLTGAGVTRAMVYRATAKALG